MPTEIANKEDVLNFLKTHKVMLEKQFGVTKIALFGSYARDEQKPSSDIDLLVEVKPELKDYNNHYNLKVFLEKELCKKIDLGYFGSVRLFVMRFIEKELIYA